MAKILVACEESQAITIKLRDLGHEAFSCDILPCSGGHPEWHLQGDVFNYINNGWDLMIAHPPCTYLSVSGAMHLYNKDGSKNLERYENQKLALDFVQKLMDVPIPRIAIENPVSVISTKIVDKGKFFTWIDKKTGKEKRQAQWYADAFMKHGLNKEQRRTARSKTFQGMAQAMADQWTNL